jgi:hypothetical protein
MSKHVVRSPLGSQFLALVQSQSDHPQVIQAIEKARTVLNGKYADLSDDTIREMLIRTVTSLPCECPTC